jgi:hypothetical protein
MPDPTPTARRATDEEVERLREYAGKIEWSGLHYPVACVGALLARIDAAEAERDAALAREEKLAEVLRPFADVVPQLRPGLHDNEAVHWSMFRAGHMLPAGTKPAPVPTVGHCRIAAAALAEHDARRAGEGA